jgi:hypothetical protein
MRARTETKSATSLFDIPKEVAAFTERIIESDPELRARYAQLIAPVKAEAGGHFNVGAFVPIEWLLPGSSHEALAGGGRSSETSAIYLVQRQLIFGYSGGSSVPVNVVAQVTATTHTKMEMTGEGDAMAVSSSQLTLHFDGFVDAKLSLDKATSQEEGIEIIESLGGKVTFVPSFGIAFESYKITDAALKHLEELTELGRLALPGDTITDDRLAHLRGLTRLEELDLNNSEVTDAGLVHLAGMNKLRSLNLTYTKVTAAGVEKLQAALPKCKIER